MDDLWDSLNVCVRPRFLGEIDPELFGSGSFSMKLLASLSTWEDELGSDVLKSCDRLLGNSRLRLWSGLLGILYGSEYIDGLWLDLTERRVAKCEIGGRCC